MKEIAADFLRQEVTRLGELVVETAVYHESGMKLFSAGDAITLAHAKALHASQISALHLLEFGEDVNTVRKTLGVQKVLPVALVPGDVLMEDLRSPGGELIVGAGTTLDEGKLEGLRSIPILAVTIRDRRLSESMRRAQEFFAQLALPEPKGMLTTRVTRAIHVTATAARYLLIPRAKVLVAVTNAPLRVFVVNALLSEGHEVVDHATVADAPELVRRDRPTLVITDLEESLSILPQFRGEDGVRNTAFVVLAEPGKSSLIYKALHAGANDWIARPPSRDVLNEKIQGCQALLGRKVKLAPSLREERRRSPRRNPKAECGLKDPMLAKPLPVVSGEIQDLGEGGLRLDYNLPAWPVPWAYTPHGVHPRHFFYTYAASNPMGHDLTVTIPGSKGTPEEKQARVVHVAPAGDLEVLGLVFPGATPDLKPMTTKRKF